MTSYKIILLLRIFFGLTYLALLYSAVKVLLNIFIYGPSGIFHDAFMIDNFFDAGFFVFFTYAISKFIFVEYKLTENTIIVNHPLGSRKIYKISEIDLIEENGEFSRWPRLYKGTNWVKLHLKDGKEINVTWIEDHKGFLQKLKAMHSKLIRGQEIDTMNA